MTTRLEPQTIYGSLASSRAEERIAFIDQIREGLTFQAVDEATKAAQLTVKDLAHFGVIPLRTLTHSRKNGRFSRTQSGRVTRFLRVWQKARETFGDAEKTRRWMDRPTRPLAGRAPVSLLDTEEGARLVEELLVRIDHGLAA